MRELHILLNTLRGLNSTNDKVFLLEQCLSEESIATIFNLAYNPRTTFGIKSIDTMSLIGLERFGTYSIDLLLDLSKRKYTGNAAKLIVEEHIGHLDVEGQELFLQILNKDLRCGVSIGLLNTAVPGFIRLPPYMRCSLPRHVDLELPEWKGELASQEKLDGQFINIKHNNLETRLGQNIPLTHFTEILTAAESTGIKHLQGEALVYEHGVRLPRKVSNGIMNSIMQGGDLRPSQQIRVYVWDFVDYGLTYYERLKKLYSYLKYSKVLRVVHTRIIRSMDEANQHFKLIRQGGKEGTVVKQLDALYIDGTSKQQIKMKAREECELYICGFNRGKGKYRDTLGSLRCCTSDDLLTVNVSGFTDAERDMIWGDRPKYQGAIVTVWFNETIKDKTNKTTLFLPIFKTLRTDRDKADTLQYILIHEGDLYE